MGRPLKSLPFRMGLSSGGRAPEGVWSGRWSDQRMSSPLSCSRCASRLLHSGSLKGRLVVANLNWVLGGQLILS